MLKFIIVFFPHIFDILPKTVFSPLLLNHLNQPSCEKRYFISSLSADAAENLRAVRGHWEIENSLHWVLDVAFGEDACQIKAENGAANRALLRHIALNLLNQEKSCKWGVKGKMLKAGRNQAYLLKVLNI